MNEQKGGDNAQTFSNIRSWFYNNFEELYKPNIGIDKSILNEKILIANPFNMILKIKDLTKTNLSTNKSTITYTLFDENNNQFNLQFPVHFEINSYVFIKNISHV